MIYFKYINGWDTNLLKHFSSVCFVPSESENIYSIERGIAHKKKIAAIQKLIERTMQSYDSEDCLYGLFSALTQAKHRISPFTATHSYCATIMSCTREGFVRINLSPIYHLGPEYLEQHQQRFGAEIDADAIIQLFDSATDGYSTDQRPFSLGIDAGIVFKTSPISHNKEMHLQFEFLNDGVMSSLSCDNQTTSKKIMWDHIGLPEALPATEYKHQDSRKIHIG